MQFICNFLALLIKKRWFLQCFQIISVEISVNSSEKDSKTFFNVLKHLIREYGKGKETN